MGRIKKEGIWSSWMFGFLYLFGFNFWPVAVFTMCLFMICFFDSPTIPSGLGGGLLIGFISGLLSLIITKIMAKFLFKGTIKMFRFLCIFSILYLPTACLISCFYNVAFEKTGVLVGLISGILSLILLNSFWETDFLKRLYYNKVAPYIREGGSSKATRRGHGVSPLLW